MTFAVADGNETLTAVTVDVSGGKDAAGNDQANYAPASEFSVDTANPTVTSVVASDLLVTDADTPGTGTFTIAVVFSETMTADGSADPTLTFGQTVSGTLTQNGVGVWSTTTVANGFARTIQSFELM